MIGNRWLPADRWFDTAAHIGSNYPYYRQPAPAQFATGIDGILQQLAPAERKIEPLGALGFLTKGYLPGNVTMVQGVRKAPWLGRPDGAGGWSYAPVPPHGESCRRPEEVVSALKSALAEEMLAYVAGRSRVAVLLSGGLDSRIAAGTLRELQERGDYAGLVTALTWGVNGCRDVLYAAEIARRYGWDWVHLPLDAGQLWENIALGAAMGAEFAPFHLHAMSQVLKLDGIDAIIAGSYGDSVGRAEFSGTRAWKLPATLGRRLDRFGLLRGSVRAACTAALHETIYGYRRHIPPRTEQQFREIEQQMHYMRRRNQGPLALIAAHVPLYQMFTAPQTCGLMWGLDYSVRGDRHYAVLLPTLPGRVGELPWARSGKPLGDDQAAPDSHAKLSHQYGRWLRDDLREKMTTLLGSEALHNLNLFNPDSLAWLARIWPRATTRSVSMLDETVAWLGALSLFADQYQIVGLAEDERQMRDTWESTRGYLYASMYQRSREFLRA